jgi:hypothetical protein
MRKGEKEKRREGGEKRGMRREETKCRIRPSGRSGFTRY